MVLAGTPVSAARDILHGEQLYLASHEFMGPPRPIIPRRVERTSPSSARAGEYIALEGELAGGAPYPFPVQPGWPQCVNWPRIEGTFEVVLPRVATTPNRFAAPNVNTPGMAAWLERLAMGEVRIAHGAPRQKPRAQLWATELDVV